MRHSTNRTFTVKKAEKSFSSLRVPAQFVKRCQSPSMRATGLLQVPWRRFTARLRSFFSIYDMHSLLVWWKSFNQYVWHKVNAQHNLVVETWCCGIVYMWHKLGHQLERRETWMQKHVILQENLCSVFKAMTWSIEAINCVTQGKFRAAQLESKKTSGCSFLPKMLRQTCYFILN